MRAALRVVVFGFVVVYSLYSVVALFGFVEEILVLACWAGGGAPLCVSLRLKARFADGCGSATLDVTGEPHGRAGGGLPLAACEQGYACF